MLEKAKKMPEHTKPEMKKQVETYEKSLYVLQQEVRHAKLPVIILFEGWGAAGKGSVISKLILNFDPRGFDAFTFPPPTELEKREPVMWRYWNAVPAAGDISVLDQSWYQELSVFPLEAGTDGGGMRRLTESVNTFERQLADGGYVILKFFLHISQKEQKKRFEELDASRNTDWRVTKSDWRQNKQYERYYSAFDKMLERTDTAYAPWHVLSSADSREALLEVYRITDETLREALKKKAEKQPAAPVDSAKLTGGDFPLVPMQPLAEVDLSATITEEEYHKKRKALQKELAELHNKLYRRKVPVIVAYEGWDAAGKGGNIRRVSAALDPRGYQVTPIAAPSAVELAHHYLWRFWMHLPKDGHIEIFDRTWYGRVMVERIEGFCSPDDWQRAYREINEFEQELCRWGAVVVKFWLQIDKDEQLRRFEDRQNTPEKQWKITDEDWRNREKWPQYEVAVNDMLQYTSTEFAPWHIVESQDKRVARIKALQILIDAIKKAL